MANNAQKTPLARTLNRFAERKALETIQLLGKALPASVVSVSGSIVTVKFELTKIPYTLPQVTVPMFGPEYIRYPVQAGDLGVVLPADARLGGVSGLGGGTADLSLPANLSALVFFPIANKNWSASENPNAVVIYGPDGAILRTVSAQHKVSVTTAGIVVSSTGPVTILGEDVVVHANHSYAQDVNGYGSKVTFNGGSAFSVDNHVLGAVVTTNSVPWTPPGPIA